MAHNVTPVQQAAALVPSMSAKDLRCLSKITQQSLSKFCQFLDDLPTELRLQVYELVLIKPDGHVEYDLLVGADQISTRQYFVSFDSHWVEPALLQTCKQIRAEALPVYLEGNAFWIDFGSYDLTSLARLLSKAKSVTKKHLEVQVVVELDGASLNDESWRNIWQWLRMYYDGAVPCRPRYGLNDCTGYPPAFSRFISALFDMLETLKKALCPWEVVEKVLKDAVDGADAVTDWSK